MANSDDARKDDASRQSGASTEIPTKDRGIPPVDVAGYRKPGQMIAVALAVVVGVGVLWLLNRSPPPKAAPNDPHATSDQRFDETQGVHAQVAPKPDVALPGALTPDKPPPPKPIPVVPKVAGDAPNGPPANGPKVLTPLEKRMGSRTVIYDEQATGTRGSQSGYQDDGPSYNARNARPAGTSPVAPQLSALLQQYGNMGGTGTVGAAPGVGLAATTEGSSKDSARGRSLASMLKATPISGAAAGTLPDRRLFLASGKLIDCALDTAISSMVSGMSKCTLTRDVYGEDGSVVVMERGTELIGEYQSNLSTGQARLGILWTRAKTPKGVVIALESPGSDELGRAGVTGFVDRHFWERYSAAILLSSLDDAFAVIASQVAARNGYYPTNTSNTTQNAAAVSLQDSLSIPPTIVKNQGEHVTVFVARDLDFRPVYGYVDDNLALNQ